MAMRQPKTPKTFLTVRIEESDFKYIKSLFRVQGYNAGVRWLISSFVRICKAREAQHVAGNAPAQPDYESVLREVGLDKPSDQAGGPDGEGPTPDKG